MYLGMRYCVACDLFPMGIRACEPQLCDFKVGFGFDENQHEARRRSGHGLGSIVSSLGSILKEVLTKPKAKAKTKTAPTPQPSKVPVTSIDVPASESLYSMLSNLDLAALKCFGFA